MNKIRKSNNVLLRLLRLFNFKKTGYDKFYLIIQHKVLYYIKRSDFLKAHIGWYRNLFQLKSKMQSSINLYCNFCNGFLFSIVSDLSKAHLVFPRDITSEGNSIILKQDNLTREHFTWVRNLFKIFEMAAMPFSCNLILSPISIYFILLVFTHKS